MAFEPGKPKSGGRVKGTPNKVNADLKNMILTALDRKGGVSYLMEQADANPTAFLSLVGKVLPMTIASDSDHPLTIQIVSGVPTVDTTVQPVNGKANGHANH